MTSAISGIVLMTSISSTYSEDCESFGASGPRPVKVPSNQTASIGDTVSFHCEGNFGCGNPETRAIDWILEGKGSGGSPVYVYELSTKARYSINNYRSANGAILGADLTITHVKREDFDWTFHCIMSSARRLNPTQHFSVQLKERRRRSTLELMKRALGNFLH